MKSSLQSACVVAKAPDRHKRGRAGRTAPPDISLRPGESRGTTVTEREEKIKEVESTCLRKKLKSRKTLRTPWNDGLRLKDEKCRLAIKHGTCVPDNHWVFWTRDKT